ncbi:hypothetical protein CRE_13802 [Caenorhabditis remanei]|uniref:Uncharacterized protein n=1 Tax=Caenorhabditis remanei TaxID=31234 RepID=E3NLX6_CAERE|nr:hypothetical protein CRE_13802 [Caenorhabditis remanei]
MIELVRVMRGRVEMKKETEESESLNTSQDVNTPEEWVPEVVIVTKPAVEPSVPIMDCEECMQEYNENIRQENAHYVNANL